ncbi:MAG TPA: hypothetical protein VHY18_13550 [Solirubrobacteraceae bacterium]|nr:hypothetical protein [Solirubrobacteraceae bacterium]
MPVGFLIAYVLFATLPAVASATTEMRGEWELVLNVPSVGLHSVGTTVITTEANAQEEFSDPITLNGFPSTFSGTLEGSKASVTLFAQGSGPIPEVEFTSNTMNIETVGGLLTISGSGTTTFNKAQPAASTLTATRLKTYKQIEEREAKEKLELEEREARQNIRGEWELTIETAAHTAKGTALITTEANAGNDFASSGTTFEEGTIPGSFSGELKGGEASVTVTTPEYGPIPATDFTSSTIKVTSSADPTSLSGTGSVTAGSSTLPATFTATRTKTYQEIVQREKAEQEAREKQEKEAQEKAKAEQEAKEKQAREATEKAARETKEKTEREAKEKQAREAAEKALIAKSLPGVTPALVPVQLGSKFTLGHGGSLSLALANPGSAPEHGHLKLTLANGAKATKHSTKVSNALGEASFSIAAHGSEVVVVKLSRSARTKLTRHKTLRVLVTITTQASGQPDTTKSQTIVLHASATRRKG